MYVLEGALPHTSQGEKHGEQHSTLPFGLAVWFEVAFARVCMHRASLEGFT